jgi:hypothetical protein
MMRDDELSFPTTPEIIDFDDPELLELEPQPQGYRCGSTPETRARYAVLRTKREGDSWQQGNILYRKGPGGITAFNFSKMTAPSSGLFDGDDADGN